MAITSLAIAFFAVLIAVAVHLGLRFRRARQDAESAGARLARVEAALQAAPCGYVVWTADGREHVSAGLGPMVGLDPNVAQGWSGVRNRLTEIDAGLLDSALADLWRHGRPFNLTASTRSDDRTLMISGTRQGLGQDYVDVVWFVNGTAVASEAGQFAADADDLMAEVRRLRGLLDALPFPVWQRSRDLGLVFCNRSYAVAADAPNSAAAVILDRELAGSAIELQGRALADRARRMGSAQSESHHVVISGARRLLEFTELPIEGQIAGFARDFTDLEGVQADLGRHIEAQAELLDHIRSGIALFDPDRRLTFFNRGYAALWRLDPDWLQTGPELGEVLEVLRERRRLPEVVDYRAWRQSRLALFTTVIGSQEEYLYLPDETTVREIVAPHPLGGLMFIYEDVTDRLALERSYNELTAVQRQTVNELQEGIAVYGTDGRLKLANPAFMRRWQLTDEDIETGSHLVEIVERNRPLYMLDASWDAFKGRMIHDVLERRAARGRIVRTDGAVLDYSTVPLPDGSVLYSETDVTDTYNVERALVERNDALQEADRLKTEFLANVSYELRTPLNTIIGFAEILSNGYFGEMNRRQAEYCRGILDASHRLLNLINDILDLAMVEAGQIVLELDRFDVGAMLGSVLNLARERARKQNLRIVLNCAPDVGSIVADERRIKQVIFNLVSNAVKFTPPGGAVTVTAFRADGELAIQVLDTGVGILKEDMERVFGAFERGRYGENRPIGAGLGLTLVKRFIEMHGGRLELTSEEGQGTIVSCYLPVDGTRAVGAADAA